MLMPSIRSQYVSMKQKNVDMLVLAPESKSDDLSDSSGLMCKNVDIYKII